MPNYRRFDTEGRPIFVTLVTHARRLWLADSRHVSLLLDAMRRVKALHSFRHLAHVVMPDHVHWMFVPEGRRNFSKIVASVKRDVTWRLKEGSSSGSPPYWQHRFFDHIIRDENDFGRHLDYIHFNPVKHGACHSPAGHPHSSFREWVSRGVYDADWGCQEPATVRGLELE